MLTPEETRILFRDANGNVLSGFQKFVKNNLK